jgi:hypothetical protein
MSDVLSRRPYFTKMTAMRNIADSHKKHRCSAFSRKYDQLLYKNNIFATSIEEKTLSFSLVPESLDDVTEKCMSVKSKSNE